MKNLLLLGVVFGCISATVPSVRERVAPRVVPVWEASIERAVPLVHRALEPFRRWQAGMEARGILNKLLERAASNERLPGPNELDDFIRARHYTTRDGRDPWGGRYRLLLTRDSILVTADGPDLVASTEDDVRVGAPRR